MKSFKKASYLFACIMLLLGSGFCVSLADTHHAYTFTLDRGKGSNTSSVYKGSTSNSGGVIISSSTGSQYKTTYYIKKSDTNAKITDSVTVKNVQWQGGRMKYNNGYSTQKTNVRLFGIDSGMSAPNGTRVSGQWTPV